MFLPDDGGPLVAHTPAGAGDWHDLFDHHDVFEHVWGLAQVGGALLAGAARLYAWQAAKAAKSSADAATEAVAIAKAEFEMLTAEANRRPFIDVRSMNTHPVPGARRSAVLQIRVLNSGNATTEGGWINLLVPPGTVISPCANDKGQGNLGPVPLQSTAESLRGTAGSEYLTAPILLVEGMPAVAHYRLDFPSAGKFSVRVKLGATRAKTVVAEAAISVS